jgi:hypothetical protein
MLNIVLYSLIVGILLTLEVHAFHLVSKSASALASSLSLFKKSSGSSTSKVSNDILNESYNVWLDTNDFLPVTAPAYLTEKQCKDRFSKLANLLGDTDAALAMIRNDPIVFNFEQKTLENSFRCWSKRLDGGSEEALKLLIRNPPLMALQGTAVLEAKPDEIIQSYFWSYFAALFRIPTKVLLTLLKPLKKSIMNKVEA